MIQRSFNAEDMRKALEPYPELLSPDFDFEEWVADKCNVVLKEGDSVGLFTFEYPGVYSGHYFFTVRGREAFDLAASMLNEMFRDYGAKVMRGMIPINNRKSRWMSRQLGCESLGYIEDPMNGESEMFYLGLDQFYNHMSQKGKIKWAK